MSKTNAEHIREWRARHPDYDKNYHNRMALEDPNYREKKRAAAREYKHHLRAVLDVYKAEHGCHLCGQRDPAKLWFVPIRRSPKTGRRNPINIGMLQIVTLKNHKMKLRSYRVECNAKGLPTCKQD